MTSGWIGHHWGSHDSFFEDVSKFSQCKIVVLTIFLNANKEVLIPSLCPCIFRTRPDWRCSVESGSYDFRSEGKGNSWFERICRAGKWLRSAVRMFDYIWVWNISWYLHWNYSVSIAELLSSRNKWRHRKTLCVDTRNTFWQPLLCCCCGRRPHSKWVRCNGKKLRRSLDERRGRSCEGINCVHCHCHTAQPSTCLCYAYGPLALCLWPFGMIL